MTSRYQGPVREEPLAIELHNTLYSARGLLVDGLAEGAGAEAWLRAVDQRLPAEARGAAPPLDELRRLRESIRAALQAALEGRPLSGEAREEINRASLSATHASVLTGAADDPSSTTTYPHAKAGQVALAAIADSAVQLLGGPSRHALRACGAPGCMLVFLKDHPRQEWCSPACGNRARQARHYARRASR